MKILRNYGCSLRPTLFVITGLVLSILVHWEGLIAMMRTWNSMEEYSHGYFIPVITLFWLKQRLPKLTQYSFGGSWYGVWLFLVGLLFSLFGTLAVSPALLQYGFVITLTGSILALLGWIGFQPLLAPLTFLLFMVPLPTFLHAEISTFMEQAALQLSAILIRMWEIDLFLNGNIIDLGNHQIEVIQACNGVRYLLPLLAISFLIANWYTNPLWKKNILILSAIPIAILFNGLRIGTLGILLELKGINLTHGLSHTLQGWVIYGACLLTLSLEMKLLTKTNPSQPIPTQPVCPDLPANSIPQPAKLTLFLMVSIAAHSVPPSVHPVCTTHVHP